MHAIVTPVAGLWDSRELLRHLVVKELKVRYKHSALGFVWSLLTPLLMTGVFTLVFATFLRIQVGEEGTFATFFLSGYLVWQFFSNSVNASTGVIVANGSLVKKVAFPREVLPLSLVLAQGVHLLLALAATAPLFIWQRGISIAGLVGVVIGLVLLVVFTAGVSMLFAAANVSFRDLQELTQVLFLGWFYITPVIYARAYAVEYAPWTLPLIDANPMAWFVRLFNSALYGDPIEMTSAGAPGFPPLLVLGICAAWAIGAFVVGFVSFRRLAVSFAKEI